MSPSQCLRMENCQVVAQRTQEKNGYTAVQLGAGLAKVKNTSKALRGHFAVANVEPKAQGRRIPRLRRQPDRCRRRDQVDHFVGRPAGRCDRHDDR